MNGLFVFNGVSWAMSLLTGTSHEYIPVEGKGHSVYICRAELMCF